MVKALGGCDRNGRYWVFAAAATNVEYTRTVTETATEAVRTYHNALGQRSPAVNDTGLPLPFGRRAARGDWPHGSSAHSHLVAEAPGESASDR